MAASKRREKIKRPIAPLRVSVKFLKDCNPGGGKPIFKAGSIHTLVISSANHWVRRGKAVKYVEKVRAAKPVSKPKKSVGRSRKSVGKSKKVDVVAEPVIEEAVGEEPVIEEAVIEETPNEESAIEEKKTEDGESLGEIPNLLA